MDWSAYAQEQGLGREVGENLVRARQLSRSPHLTTGDLLRALVRDTGHAGAACAALGLEQARVEPPLEELAVTPEPLVLQGPTELSGPLASVLLHVQDEGNLLGLQSSGSLLLALRPDRLDVVPSPPDPLDSPGHGELALEMLGVERHRLRNAVLEAIAKSHPDARDWETRSEGFLRLSRFHMAYPYPGEPEPASAQSEAAQEAALLPAMAAHYLHASAEDLKWLGTALYDERKKWFVVRLVRLTESVPSELLEPLICASIYEQDPSRNRHFVEAAIRGVGLAPVHERLLWYMRQGVDAEKAGAMRALYWCPPPDADSVKETAQGLLDAFQRESDLDVRRHALSKLALIDWRAMDAALRTRLAEVLELAATHPDVYIRQRADAIRMDLRGVLS
ncbi:MAG: hypothetical protein JXB05_13975 [Myxococcaceae bacterium]|nr:hypothetical protein [Myxococcaceae bacterium]